MMDKLPEGCAIAILERTISYDALGCLGILSTRQGTSQC